MLTETLKRFFVDDDSGQGLVEYALIIALVALVVIAAIVLLGGRIRDIFQGASDELANPGGTTTTP